ncbi:cyclopropane fatty acyl phospholipid synthase [Legionella norrlandica]|uniref:cyclopropane fatty acyl phospholipid synthase n=1 Tax=Legionella norrlandica TaxID=1498499 RepID=UPI0006915C53|nr:cyclopropane fatty acyl phospholipid synthase [Legionella norrlandica]
MLQQILDEIGVTINGNKPYDIKIHDKRFYLEVLKKKSIGAGESYMKGWWDCDQLDELFYRICRHKLYDKLSSTLSNLFLNLKYSLFNQQSRSKSETVANVHYNLGNRLYECMLGKSMAYTCGYWKEARNLDEAEFAKYELVCKKMYLNPGEKVLELGCGWGGLAKYIAEKYGCEVVACDIGREPAAYAKNLCRDLPVKIYQCDYRDIEVYNLNAEKFDKVVSVGVLEHVGYKNYGTFLDIARRFIKDDGLFLLHSIGGNVTKIYCDPWINKYIFPNGHLPSLKQLGKAFEGRFIVEDLQNFGAFYDKTLLGWYQNLNAHWHELKSSYDENFHRMMNYYLLTCAGGFRARDMELWQFALTPKGMLHGYTSFR